MSKKIYLTLASLLLGACGGGGGESPGPLPTPTATPSATPMATPARHELLPAPTVPSTAEVAALNGTKKSTNIGTVLSQSLRPYDISVAGRQVITVRVADQEYTQEMDLRELISGPTATPLTQSGLLRIGTEQMNVSLRGFQGQRSGLLVAYSPNGFLSFSPLGVSTPLDAVPSAGRATYNGIAFNRSDVGKFTYDVDFGDKTGVGHIDGFSRHGLISLKKTNLRVFDKTDHSSNFRGEGSDARGEEFDYTLTLKGAKAEELTGLALGEDSENAIGLHGTRGAITP